MSQTAIQIEERIPTEKVSVTGPSQAGANGQGLYHQPPLESGDRLTRAEFERRYSAQPESKKAELVEGVVYVASPVRVRQHGEPHSHIIIWAGTYFVATPGTKISDNVTLRLDEDNEPQPDVALWIDQPAGGRAHISPDDYLAGAPELIIEIAASTAAYDLHDKRNAYRRNGVQEYLVMLPYEQQTIWYSWHEGRYHELPADEAGIIRSGVFPGLWLHPQRFWAGDLAGVLAVLQQGLQTPDHAAFVQRLAGASSV
jgi:Uma2 family endonuclease